MSVATLESRIELLEKQVANILNPKGIIRQSAYEELMEYVDKKIHSIGEKCDDDDLLIMETTDKLKEFITAYHDEKQSPSPAVKAAREKTDEEVVREFATKFTENIKCSNLDRKIKSLLYVYIEDFTDLYVENHINKE